MLSVFKMNGEKTKVFREVNYKWDRVMKIGEAIKYGKCLVIFENGEPVRVEKPLQIFDLKIPEKEFEERLKTIGI